MQLIYAFVFIHAKCRFSHGMAHIHLLVDIDFIGCIYRSPGQTNTQSLGFKGQGKPWETKNCMHLIALLSNEINHK